MVASPETFPDWTSLNDTIMGGRSRAGCHPTAAGLVFEGDVVAEGGGFVSCRSPNFRPPLNLSGYQGLRLRVDGDGRTLKLAVACSDGVLGLTELIPGGLRWVAPIHTQAEGTTVVDVHSPRGSGQPGHAACSLQSCCCDQAAAAAFPI